MPFFSLNPDYQNIFLINWGQIVTRLDPSFNLAFIQNQIISSYAKHRLGILCKSFTGGTPSKSNPLYWTGEIPWVSPKDMKRFYLGDTIDHITQDAVKETSTTLVPEGSMLIVVRSGILKHTIPVSITTRQMTINQDIKALVFTDAVLPAYPAYFIDVYQSKLLPLIVKHSTTVQSINTEQFNALAIPVPPKRVQAEIVAKMDAAYAAKAEMETEAQRLLDSIDAYLLGELGIELPEEEKNKVENRVFFRSIREVSGGRLDPTFYRSFYSAIVESIKTVYHKKLGHIVKFSSELWNQRDLFTSTFPYIEIGEIDLSFGAINKINYLDIDEAPSRARMIIRGGDILISTTRPSRGAIVKMVQTNEIFIASTGFAVIRKVTDPKVDPNYLHLILRQILSLRQMEQRSSGGNYPAISQEELANIIVPVPTLQEQKEIINRIITIQNQTRQLQQQAVTELAQAKQAVEAMILGE